MWHRGLFVWLVIWITASGSPLKSNAGPEDLPILIPDLSNVDSYALQRIEADKFLTLWHINVLSGPTLISDEPWTVLIPKNSGLPRNSKFIIDAEYTREILMNHVIIGDIIDRTTAAIDPNLSFYSLSDTELKFSSSGDTTFVNGVRLTGDVLKYKNGIIYVIEKSIEVAKPDYLKFAPEMKENIFDLFGNSNTNTVESVPLKSIDDIPKPTTDKAQDKNEATKSDGQRLTRFEKFRNRSIKESPKIEGKSGKELSSGSSIDDIQQLNPISELFSNAKSPPKGIETTERPKLAEFTEIFVPNETFLESLKQESEAKNSLAREFYTHILVINIDKLLTKDEQYTAVIATDDAFYDFYPIDWGFNPFLVKNFTRDVLLNHIIPGNVNFHELPNGSEIQTLGGRQLTIHTKEGNKIEVNGHPIPTEFELEVNKGRIYYIDKLLFVDIDRVNALRDQYPHLESGPLISSPWPTSPFLSHLVKRLRESSKDTPFIDILLKSTVIHEFSTSNDDLQRLAYTAFIPTNETLSAMFTATQLEEFKQPLESFDRIESARIVESANNFVLGHIFHDYLLETDFNSTGSILSMANQKVNYVKSNGAIKIGDAMVMGKQQYLYNLGAFYFIDGAINPIQQSTTEVNSVADAESHITTVQPVKIEDFTPKGIIVPFPKDLNTRAMFPSISDTDYRFETRTEISFSRQINDGEMVPVTREEIEKAKRRRM